MKSKDVRFEDREIGLLTNMVGKTMEMYKCDPFLFAPSVFGIVGITVDGESYALTNTIRPMDYYGATEDVAIFRIAHVDAKSIHSMVKENEMVTMPVHEGILKIDIVNETQKVYKDGIQIYRVELTRGLIFYLTNGSELSFEKNVWFSEDITIQKGECLIDRFTPENEFSEDWEGEYRGVCTRGIITIN